MQSFSTQQNNPQSQLRLAAMNLLARREHSFNELLQKLGRPGVDSELLESVVQRLADQGLQSDERFCEHFIRYRAERGYGPIRIRQELKQRGVEDTLIERTLENAELDWFKRAFDLGQRRFGSADPDQPSGIDPKSHQKRYAFLIRRGFSPETVSGVLRELGL